MKRFQLLFLITLFFLAPVAAMAQVVDPCIDPLDPEHYVYAILPTRFVQLTAD